MRVLVWPVQSLTPLRVAVGFLALVAAAQLVFLQSSSAALECREQLASAERLVMPALTLFFCLCQVSWLIPPIRGLLIQQ